MGLVFPAIVLATIILVLAHALLSSERAVKRSFRAHNVVPPGIQLALRHSAPRHSASRLPWVVVIPDPAPLAKVVRKPGGRGTLLISQGLLARFKDEELVAVMRHGIEMLSRRGVSWRSACSGWLMRTQGLKRQPMTPFRAVLALALFPLESFLRRQDHALDVPLDRD